MAREVKGRPRKVCTVVGCAGKHEAKGLCKKHYMEDYNRQKKSEKNAEEPPASGQDEQPLVADRSARKDDKPHQARSKKADNSIGSITVNFLEDDEHIFQAIQESAQRNRRTLTSEVLFWLERSDVVK